ncbi:MAG TPA: cytochrome ubiquinol oxidase subunit I, partial [Solirubrobacteraceae bacterium]|nr:cytochrome ubiquinol oxidase subunit I [Solirubrobacteraceae bacterium]
FIMAANSWMQHPVGYKMNAKGEPTLDNVGALFTNPTFLWGYVHVILASLVTGALVMLAVSAWQIRKQREAEGFRHTARLSLVVLLPSIVLALFVGSELGVIEARYQPMKIAAAEAQWKTCKPCSFSLFQIGGGKNDHTPSQIIEIPHVLSLLATNSWDGEVKGLGPLQKEYERKYGPGEYVPNVFLQYWSMRIMAYIAAAVLLFTLWGAWLLHRGTLERSKWFLRLGVWAVVTPFLMNTAGWMLTENGRQPWIVQGLMKTVKANSPSVSAGEVWASLIGFVLIFAALGAADVYLMLRYARKGLPVEEPQPARTLPPSTPVLTY